MKCGSCKGDHATVADVKRCYGAPSIGADRVPVQSVAEFEAIQADVSRPRAPRPTEKQVAFYLKLIGERPMFADVMNFHADTVDKMDRKMMSTAIGQLLEQKPETGTAVSNLPDVPAGYYAVRSLTGNNDLDFFRVDRPDEGKYAGRTFVHRVIGGHSDTAVRFPEAKKALEAIVEAGMDASRIAYGLHLGRCYKCNKHLTDELSRKLGIGPKCREG